MADDELKRLLEGLFSDIPTETAPQETPPKDVVQWREEHELEKVAARFQAAARLSHAASSILSLDELLPQVVELIRADFDYYYVGIFLADENHDWAVLQAGTGEAGRQMVEQGHQLRIGNESMIGWCTANKQARIALDVGQEAVRFVNPLLPDTRSEIALPLLSRGRVIGAMTIQSARPAAFSEEDITILQTMADQLANAVENARLFEERERRITELAVVNKVGQALASALELDELFEMVYQQVGRLFDTTNFYLATHEEGSDKWTSAFHLEGGERQPVAQYGIEAGLTGYIIRNRQPLLFRSMEDIIAFIKSQGAEAIGEMAQSWLGVPLISADKLVGVMAIQNYEHEDLYGEQDLALFSTVGAAVANALDNQRLLEEARRRAQQLEAINEVGQALTSVLDLDAVLRQIVDITKARFGHYYVSILLVVGEQLVFRDGSTVGSSGIRVESGQVAIDLLLGPSLSAEAVRTRRPVLADDVLADPRYLPVAELPDTRSELAVPIEVKGRVIGVLDVQSERPFAYDQIDVALLQSLASQAGVAIENARLFEETQQRIGQTQLLLSVSEATASTLESTEVMRRIARAVAGALGADTTAAYVLDETGQWLQPVAGYRVPPAQLEMYQRVQLPVEGHPFIEEAIGKQQTVFASDTARDARYDEEIARFIPARSVLLTPMMVKDEAIGVLWAVWWEQAHELTDEEQGLAEGLVRQAAIAIDSARLFGETRRRAEEFAALHEVSLELAQEQRDLDTVLETITRQAMALLDSDGGGIWLWREEAQELELATTYRVDDRDFTGRRLKPGEDLTGRAFVERRIQVVDDYPAWTGRSSTFLDVPFASGLAAPMIWQAQAVGVLVVTRSQRGRPFAADEQNLAELLAAQAAAIIRNARLLDQTQRRLQELIMLSDVSQALAATPVQAEEVAAIIAHQFVQVMGVAEASLSLLDPQEGVMQVVADYFVDQGSAEIRPEEKVEVFRLADYPATADVMERLEPLVVHASDPDADPAELAYMKGQQVSTLVVIPLAVKGQSIGVVELEVWNEEHHFTAQELDLAMTLANQAAVALENARLFEETQQRLQERTMLSQVSQALADAPLQAEEIAEIIGRQFVEVMGVPEVSVSLRDPETEGLMRVVADLFGEEESTRSHKNLQEAFRLADYPATADVMEKLTPLVVHANDPAADPAELAYMQEYGVLTLAVIPLAAKGQAIGVIELESRDEERHYTPEELDLAMTLTNQAAVALENARLLEQTQYRAREMEAINELGRVITSVLDPQALLRQIVDTIKARFNYYFVAIQFLEEGQVVFRDGSTIGESDVRLEPGGLAMGLQHPTGLIVEAARSGQPVLSGDTLTDPRYVPIPEIPDTRSELSLPIEIKGQIIGVLDVQSNRPFAFNEDDVALLQSLASQAGVAIENARLFEEAQARTEEQAVLNELGQALTARLTVEEVLDEAYRGASRLVDTTNFYIGLYDPERDEIRFAFDVSESGQDEDIAVVSAEQGLAGYMIRNRTSVLLEEKVRERQEALGVTMIGEEPLSWLGVPLIVGDRVLGAMAVQSFTTPCAYDEHDRELLIVIASLTAIALQNAYLFEETRSRAEEQTILRRITEAVSRSLEMKDLLETVLAETLASLDFDSGLVSLVEEDTGQLYLAAEQGLPTPMAQMLAQDGLAGTLCDLVYQSGETVFISDVRQGAPVDVSGPIKHGLLTYLGIPLEYRDKNEGTICLFNRYVREATSREIALLEAIGRQVAMGMDNVRLFEQTQAALAEVEATHRSYLRRGWQDHLRQPEMLEQSGFLYDQTTAQRTEELIADPNLWRPEVERALIARDVASARDGAEDGGRSGLAIPIALRGQIFGVLGIESPTGDRQWSEDDIALIQAVSDQLAQTLEAARLFADTQRRAERERLIGEITTKIRASTDIQDILETTAVELGRALGTSRALVRLGFENAESAEPGGSPQPDEPPMDNGLSTGDGEE
jgi:GAF domain-containing protein